MPCKAGPVRVRAPECNFHIVPRNSLSVDAVMRIYSMRGSIYEKKNFFFCVIKKDCVLFVSGPHSAMGKGRVIIRPK